MKAMEQNKLSGFIDVKIPPKGRKIGPWKAWKRQWCTIKKSPVNNGVELILGSNSNNINNTIDVPICSILCRSESRSRSYAFGIFSSIETKSNQPVIYLAGRSETESQEWLSQIRKLLRPNVLPGDEFSISLIDNSFSRESGLFGTYGVISLNEAEMTIRDPSNGEVSASWKWSQIDHTFVLEPPRNSDDIGRILVIQLRKSDEKDSEGGMIYLFCSEADRLQSAVCQYRLGRQHRLVTSPLPPTPPVEINNFRLNTSRRLSRSEGDLRWPLHSSLLLSHLHSRCGSRERNSKSLSNSGDDDKEKNALGKIARRLILASANFGLLLSTPGCSEPDSLHEYQTLNCDDNIDGNVTNYKSRHNSTNDLLDELDDLGELHSQDFFRTVSAPGCIITDRRVSVASGIYAEIDEDLAANNSEKYENLNCFQMPATPPPLPPRRTDSISERKGNYTSCSNNAIYDNNNEADNKGTSNETSCLSILHSRAIIKGKELRGDDINNDENLVTNDSLPLPPPLPPRGVNTRIRNDRNDEYVSMSYRTNPQTARSETVYNGNETSEPDYLPMSQVPTKIIPNKEDTYVVMANLINNKVAVSGL